MSSQKQTEFSTNICCEEPAQYNPFLSERRFLKGYDCRDLWRQCNFIEVLLLQFIGELPNKKHQAAVEMLFVGLINLGPRDVAIRSAMLAGLTKTMPEHLLPIGLLANQGDLNGAKEAESAHQFITENLNKNASQCVQNLVGNIDKSDLQNNTVHIIPGFGASYGDVDPIIQNLAEDISSLLTNSAVMQWCNSLIKELGQYRQGWLAPGLVAAVCIEVGIGAREAIGIFQLAKSVGVVAQGMEQTHRTISDATLLSDSCYEYSP